MSNDPKKPFDAPPPGTPSLLTKDMDMDRRNRAVPGFDQLRGRPAAPPSAPATAGLPTRTAPPSPTEWAATRQPAAIRPVAAQHVLVQPRPEPHAQVTEAFAPLGEGDDMPTRVAPYNRPVEAEPLPAEAKPALGTKWRLRDPSAPVDPTPSAPPPAPRAAPTANPLDASLARTLEGRADVPPARRPPTEPSLARAEAPRQPTEPPRTAPPAAPEPSLARTLDGRTEVPLTQRPLPAPSLNRPMAAPPASRSTPTPFDPSLAKTMANRPDDVPPMRSTAPEPLESSAPAPAKAVAPRPGAAKVTVVAQVKAAPAGLFRRTVSWVVDLIVITGLVSALMFVAVAVSAPAASAKLAQLEKVALPAAALTVLIAFVYSALFAFLWQGRTFGRRLVGIHLVDGTGSAPGPVRAVFRAMLSVVSFAFFLSGFWLALFDRKGQTLHDKLSRTFVVRLGADAS